MATLRDQIAALQAEIAALKSTTAEQTVVATPAPAKPREVTVLLADGTRTTATLVNVRAEKREAKIAAGTHVACEQPGCNGVMHRDRSTQINGKRSCGKHYR